MSIAKQYRSIGLLFLGRPRWGTGFEPADYFDFQHIKWSKDQLLNDLKAGNLPQGLIVVLPDGAQKVVIFDKKENYYSLCPLFDMLSELNNMAI